MISYKEKLPQITTFIFDVDGVLTNGDIGIYKDEILRTLNAKDGYAIQHAIKKDYKVFAITGGNCESIKHRLLSLGCNEVVLAAKDKLSEYNKLKNFYQFEDNQVLYMGDDIPDYPVLKTVGLSSCPQDAVNEIKELCDYQSPFNGGQKCVRDVIEQTLKCQGNWFTNDAFHW